MKFNLAVREIFCIFVSCFAGGMSEPSRAFLLYENYYDHIQ